MRIMAVFTLIFAMIALVLTGMYILSNWNPDPGMGLIWKYVSFWPATFIDVIVGVFRNPASFLQLSTFIYTVLVIHIGAVITAVMLARSLDRHAWDWGIATFVFPYAAPFFLAVLKEH